MITSEEARVRMLWASGAPMEWRWKDRYPGCNVWQNFSKNHTLEDLVKVLHRGDWEFRKKPDHD